MIKDYLPHLTFFAVFFTAAVPVLYYLSRKNPDPRFRPSFGEMSLLTLLAVFICGGMALGIGSLFKPENDGSSLKKKSSEGPGRAAAGPEENSGRRSSQDRGNRRQTDRN
jgi:hypothetical protein